MARAAAYVNLYENMLNGQGMTPLELLSVYRQALTREPEELNLKLLTGQASAIFWQFLSPAAARWPWPPRWSRTCGRRCRKTRRPTPKSCCSKPTSPLPSPSRRRPASTKSGRRKKRPAGVKLTEDDYTALALALAVRDYAAAAAHSARSSWPASKTRTAASACNF